ncbi:104_t:CDS:2 [Funneliformis mosseae]|uniref:104_t:CDS:1 n=1 Tax=Funneliformis mosseae TaxID=27381 RepID=A0A9N9GKK5_FUNMO|nr:104_t:CDS:2 [Funneliformis mosseae]
MAASRLEIQKRIQQRLKTRTDTTSRPTPRTYQQLPHFLQQVLPDNYTYIIKSYKELELESFSGAPTAAFDSTFYVNIASSEAIEEWRSAFHNKTGTIFRITRADKVKGIKVIYHKDFHCRHADIAAIKYMQKTYAQKAGQRRSRNTNCQCLAKIRLEKSRLQLSHPCEIHLVYNHNHPLETFNLAPATPATPIEAGSPGNDESGKDTSQDFDFDSPISKLNFNFLFSLFSVEDYSSIENDNFSNEDITTTARKINPHQQTSSFSSCTNSSQISTINTVSFAAKTFSEFQQFVKECEVDILKGGDAEYCKGIIKFMASHKRARAQSLSHAASFLNQFSWPEPTNIEQHSHQIQNFGSPQFITYPYHHQPQFTSVPVQFSGIASEQFLPQQMTTINETDFETDVRPSLKRAATDQPMARDFDPHTLLRKRRSTSAKMRQNDLILNLSQNNLHM